MKKLMIYFWISGASFAEALGMVSPAKPKKKPTSGGIKEFSSPLNSFDSPDVSNLFIFYYDFRFKFEHSEQSPYFKKGIKIS